MLLVVVKARTLVVSLPMTAEKSIHELTRKTLTTVHCAPLRVIWRIASLSIINKPAPSSSAKHVFLRLVKARDYFFINSITAVVIALIPVRRVGSGSGSNKLECSDGRGFPDFLAASTLAGSTAPNQNMKAGIR